MVTALKRKDLDPVEEANAYQRLIDGGLTKRGAAQTIGVPQKTITARLQILALPEKLRPLVAAGTIPLSAVAELARIAGFSTRLAERVGAEGASSGCFDFWVAEQIARGIKTLHPTNDIDVDALKLDAAAREKIDALSDSWSKGRPRLREQDLDRARAAGVLYEEPRQRTEASWGFARAIICDTEIARELTLAALSRDWRQRQRRLAEQRRQDGKPEPGTPQHEREKQRRKKQRAREQELREWARGANLDLGRKLLDTLASVELAKPRRRFSGDHQRRLELTGDHLDHLIRGRSRRGDLEATRDMLDQRLDARRCRMNERAGAPVDMRVSGAERLAGPGPKHLDARRQLLVELATRVLWLRRRRQRSSVGGDRQAEQLEPVPGEFDVLGHLDALALQ